MTDPTPITDPTTTTEVPAAESAAVAPEAGTAPDGQPDDAGDDREAAKFRKQARAAQAKSDALVERLGALQRTDAVRVASAVLAQGEDLFLAGTQLDDLLDDAGDLDEAKVTAAATAIIADRPHFGRRQPAAFPASSITGRASTIDGTPATTWSDVLRRD